MTFPQRNLHGQCESCGHWRQRLLLVRFPDTTFRVCDGCVPNGGRYKDKEMVWH